MRVIPSICFCNNQVFKTRQFYKSQYLGDIINIVRLFNDLFCDEICLVNLDGNLNLPLIKKISEEASMPLSYAGSVKNCEDIEKLISLGVEKIILNSIFFEDIDEFRKILHTFGRSTISFSIDYRGDSSNNEVFYSSGKVATQLPVSYVIDTLLRENILPGELILTSIDRDGTFSGLDTDMYYKFAQKINCPVVLNCGLSSYAEIDKVNSLFKLNGIIASGLFVYASLARGILVNYQINEQLHHIKNQLTFIYE